MRYLSRPHCAAAELGRVSCHATRGSDSSVVTEEPASRWLLVSHGPGGEAEADGTASFPHGALLKLYVTFLSKAC